MASGHDAAQQLLERVLGSGAAMFDVEIVSAESENDWFDVQATTGRVLLRGTSGVAVASALRWYLRTACHAQVTWDAPTPRLPSTLPTVASGRMSTPHRYRYHFNFCTFGYLTAFWDWDRWERYIDWMAMHGVNAPLALTGSEAVWQRTLTQVGVTDDAARTFLGGPAYLPWTWLASAHSWGGPLPQRWIDDHADLGRRIVDRERSLGMRPILQGFAGQVPPGLSSNATTTSWWDFEVPVLDPRDPLFHTIGRTFVEEQTRLFGTDHIYAADPFVETTPPVEDPAEVATVARAVHTAMSAADPQATWVLQAWPFFYRKDYWTDPRRTAFLDAVPDDRMLVLDLWGEHQPVWSEAGGYGGKPWVWCMLHSLGGRPGMYGNLDRLATTPRDVAADPRGTGLAGVGADMESFGTDPVMYEMLADVAWHGAVPDVDAWVAQWVESRYGRSTPELLRAWNLLRGSVYASTGPGPVGSIIISRPSVADDLRPAQPLNLASPPEAHVPPELAEAWTLLVSAAAEYGSDGPLGRDLADVSAEVLTRLACGAQENAAHAALGRDGSAFTGHAERLLTIITDLDRLLSTRPEYQLADWLEDARAWAETDDERALYEWNARRLITLWASGTSKLHDYSGRHWAGLVREFYLPRWRYWRDTVAAAIEQGTALRAETFESSLIDWEEAWVASQDRMSGGEPRDIAESTVQVATDLLRRYGGDLGTQRGGAG
ncbi:MAG TPA: alpha-N-acetylglucosaminidase [Jiangellaceae bacterium]|nr:alpha-N-acetylglucosaminidase [Jiangellaceae bacterium]